MDPRFGLFDANWMQHMKQVAAALVHYTPKEWQQIHCFVRTRGEGNTRELAYAITCPDHPDDGTSEPGKDVHKAMCDLIRYYTREGAPFAGIRVVVEIQPDNTFRNRFSLVPAPEGTWTPGA